MCITEAAKLQKEQIFIKSTSKNRHAENISRSNYNKKLQHGEKKRKEDNLHDLMTENAVSLAY